MVQFYGWDSVGSGATEWSPQPSDMLDWELRPVLSFGTRLVGNIQSFYTEEYIRMDWGFRNGVRIILELVGDLVFENRLNSNQVSVPFVVNGSTVKTIRLIEDAGGTTLASMIANPGDSFWTFAFGLTSQANEPNILNFTRLPYGFNTTFNQSAIFGGADWLQGGPSTQVIEGFAGDDTLFGGTGADSVVGGLGNDTIRVGPGGVGQGEVLDGDGQGNDFSIDRLEVDSGGSNGTSVSILSSNAVDLRPAGAIINFEVFSIRGEVIITPQQFVAANFSVVQGTIGSFDTLTFVSNNLSLANFSATQWTQGQDVFGLVGTAGNDTLSGSAFNDVFVGLEGADSMTGRAGSDTFIFQQAHANVGDIVDGDAPGVAPGGDIDRIQVNGGTVTSGSYNNTFAVDFRGVQFQNIEEFEVAGGEVILSAAQAQQLINEQRTFRGSAGVDIINVTFQPGENEVYADEFGLDWNLVNWSADDQIVAFIGNAGGAFYGSNQRDRIFGGAGNDALYGRGGDDTLIGGDGQNLLEGGAGADLIYGGNFLDTVSYASSSVAVSVDMLDLYQVGRYGDAEGDNYSGIENIRGSEFNDFIRWTGMSGAVALEHQVYGGGGNDTIYGVRNAGKNDIRGESGDDLMFVWRDGDRFSGGTGTDRLRFDERFNFTNSSVPNGLLLTMAENAANGAMQYATGTIGPLTFRVGSDIENLSTTWFNDTITGNSQNNEIFGATGADQISGGGGNDRLLGGDDTDTLLGGAGNDTLNGGVADDMLNGGDGDDSIISGTGSDLIVASTGVDVVTDFTVTGLYDRLDLTAFTALSSYSAVMAAAVQSGADTVITLGAGSTITLQNVTRANLTAANFIVSSVGNVINGTAGADSLAGTAASEEINGLGGSDTLSGGAGNDTLNGGADSDAAVFGGTRSNYTLKTSFNGSVFTTTVTDAVGSDGVDSLTNIEALSFNGAVYGLRGVQQNLISNMDGQRYDDVLFQHSTTGQIIYQNMTAGSGGGFVNVLLGMPAGWKVFSSDDITGDGRAEVFLHDANTGTIYAYNTAPGAIAWTSITTGFTSNFQPIATGDVTRDGVADFIVRNNTTGEVFVGDINAGGAFGGFTVMPNVGTGWRTVGLGDFNADGASDILIQKIADGTTYYWNAVNSSFGVVSTALGTDWIAKEAADMNGDGYCDVIFRNTSNGNIWYRDMLGGTGGNWGTVANGLTDWDVRNTADVDNDGYRDVIIQKTSDGTTYYADMNNGVFSAFGTVTTAVGTSWLVV